MRRRHLLDAAAFLLTLAPLAYFLHGGALTTSLWLDEIVYFNYETAPWTVRAAEVGRPGSWLAAHVGIFTYSDVQRAVHTLFGALGFDLLSAPEVYLRATPLASFVALALLVFVTLRKRGQATAEATVGTLCVTSLSLPLTYAFEARVYMLASLVAAAYLLLVRRAVARGRNAVVVAAVAGILLQRLNWWAVCLPGGLLLAGTAFAALRRQRGAGLLRLAAVTVPAGLLAVAEAAFFHLSEPPDAQRYTLFDPRGIGHTLGWTLFVPFGGATQRLEVRPEAGFWLLALSATLVVALPLAASWDLRHREEEAFLPAGALAGVLLSAVVGGVAGALVIGRHQVHLFVALLFALSFGNRRSALLARGLLVCTALAFLQPSFDMAVGRGNGKSMANYFTANASPGFAVVLQQGTASGYVDPLNSFGLDFYLNRTRPGLPAHPIHELPTLRRVDGTTRVFPYFGGGIPLARAFEVRRRDDWESWLARSPYAEVWFVAPLPKTEAEQAVGRDFWAAASAAGFREDRSVRAVFWSFPASTAQRFVRVVPVAAPSAPRVLG